MPRRSAVPRPRASPMAAQGSAGPRGSNSALPQHHNVIEKTPPRKTQTKSANKQKTPPAVYSTFYSTGSASVFSHYLNKRVFNKEQTAGLIYHKPTPEIATFLYKCKLDFPTDFLIVHIYFLLRRPKRPFHAKTEVIFIKCETFFRQRIVSENKLCLDTEFLSSSLRNPEGNLLFRTRLDYKIVSDFTK